MKKLMLLLMVAAVGLLGKTVEVVDSGKSQLVLSGKNKKDKISFTKVKGIELKKLADTASEEGTVGTKAVQHQIWYKHISEMPTYDSSTDDYELLYDGNGEVAAYMFFDKNTSGNVCLYPFNNNPAVGLMNSYVHVFKDKPFDDGQASGTRKEYYNAVVWNSNSFGGWIYIDSQTGYGNTCQLAARDDTIRGFQSFNFKLLSNGLLEVRSNTSLWATDDVRTTSPVPMDEWVYIQAYQFGASYSVGWKKKDGTQHIASGNIIPNSYLGSLPEGGTLQEKINAESATYHYEYNFYANNCPTVKARNFFWQPGDTMFSNYADTDIRDKEIGQSDIWDGAYLNGAPVESDDKFPIYPYFYILDDQFLTHLTGFLNNYLDADPLYPSMFVVYHNDLGYVVGFDFRGDGCEGPFPLN